jgi:acid phosphatase
MRLLPRALTVTSVLVAGLAAAACSTPTHAQAPAVARAQAPVTKLLVFVEENHSLDQMRAGMPYTAGLAGRYGYATDYHAISHPSLPNYIALAGGQTFGVRDDALPSGHRLAGRSVFSQALRHGRTAATYAEGMGSACGRTNTGAYAARHNPWTYFIGERKGCAAHDLGLGAFATAARTGRLPNVGLVVPNLAHDAHDGTLASADAWFRTQMQKVFAGPDWKSGRLAVVLTADEDDRTQGNKVLTVVIHPSQDHHVVRTRLTHYSLTRLYDEVAHLPYLANAATAPSMARAFGLPLS